MTATQDSTVQDVINGLSYLINAYKFGVSEISAKLNLGSLLNFNLDKQIIAEVSGGINFVKTFPAMKAEILGAMTPDQIAQINTALISLGVIKAGADITPLLGLVDQLIVGLETII